MTELDLHAIAERYHRALDAKPGKGPISDAGIAAITDSVCDIPQLLAEVEQLRLISNVNGDWNAKFLHEQAVTTAAIARAEIAEAALREFAEHGTRHDTSPTILSMSDGPSRTGGWYGYIQEMDAYVRDTARRALGGE